MPGRKKIILLQPRHGKYDMYICDLPLSLIYLSTIIAHQQNYEIQIIDQRVEADWQSILSQSLTDEVLMVGLTAMTGEPIKHALELCEFVRNHTDRPIVWGGVHPTIMPELTLEHPLVDYVIVGKGEFAIVELAEYLQSKRDINQVSGLVYKGPGGEIKKNPVHSKFDWNELPRIPYELVDHSKYYRSGFDGRVVSIMTSRNCPHRCTFCYNSSLEKAERWIAEPFEMTRANLRMLIENFKPDYISFIDDDFFVDRKRARRILELIRDSKWQIKVGFRGARVDELLKLDDEFLQLLVDVNARHINIGVESGSERILKILRKGITPEMVIKLNRRLAGYPTLIPLYNFFSGIPGETKQDIRFSTNLILQLVEENPYCQISGFHQYTPYPGSVLYDTAKKHGFKEPDSLEGWSRMQLENNARNCPWISPQRLRLLNVIYTMIYFVDRKYDIYFAQNNSKLRALLPFIKLYRRIARFRLRYHFTFLPFEVWAKDLFYKVMQLKS